MSFEQAKQHIEQLKSKNLVLAKELELAVNMAETTIDLYHKGVPILPEFEESVIYPYQIQRLVSDIANEILRDSKGCFHWVIPDYFHNLAKATKKAVWEVVYSKADFCVNCGYTNRIDKLAKNDDNEIVCDDCKE